MTSAVDTQPSSPTAPLLVSLLDGSVEVVDLTSPLNEETPLIQLPPERGQPWAFEREVISHYDEAGPTVYWNNIRLSEHTGTHFDAPIHWVTGKDLDDVSQVPPQRLVAPACVLDFSAEATADPDFLLQRHHVEAWQEEHGPLIAGGWLLYRTGWESRQGSQDDFLNGSTHTRHLHRVRPMAGRGDRDHRRRRGDRRHRRRPGRMSSGTSPTPATGTSTARTSTASPSCATCTGSLPGVPC